MPLSTKVAYAISVAVLGMLCGGIGATTVSNSNAAAAAEAMPVGHVEPRTSVDEKITSGTTIRAKASRKLTRTGFRPLE
jgi:hypothetical protein